jgi:hypothetical protein
VTFVKAHALLVAGIAVAASACRHDARDATLPADTSATPTTASAVPVDHLAQDELLEGSEKAFGLTLPRDAQVTGRFADVVYASAHAQPSALVKYFRARVRDGSVTVGDKSATFDRVKLAGKPGLELEIKIAPGLATTRIEVRDVSPVDLPNLPDDEARMRAAGFQKNGKLLDPQHVE